MQRGEPGGEAFDLGDSRRPQACQLVARRTGQMRREDDVGEVVQRGLRRQGLGVGRVDERTQPTTDQLCLECGRVDERTTRRLRLRGGIVVSLKDTVKR